MLKIYTSEQKAKELSKLDIAPDIEDRFFLRLTELNQDTLFKDEDSIRVLKEIEGMKERKPNGYIDGKFGDVHLRDLSTGGKGLLLAITYKEEFIVNIDELGYNCIHLLFDITKDTDIEVISTRILYHMEPEYKALVNGKEFKGKNISREMRRYNNGID